MVEQWTTVYTTRGRAHTRRHPHRVRGRDKRRVHPPGRQAVGRGLGRSCDGAAQKRRQTLQGQVAINDYTSRYSGSTSAESTRPYSSLKAHAAHAAHAERAQKDTMYCDAENALSIPILFLCSSIQLDCIGSFAPKTAAESAILRDPTERGTALGTPGEPHDQSGRKSDLRRRTSPSGPEFEEVITKEAVYFYLSGGEGGRGERNVMMCHTVPTFSTSHDSHQISKFDSEVVKLTGFNVAWGSEIMQRNWVRRNQYIQPNSNYDQRELGLKYLYNTDPSPAQHRFKAFLGIQNYATDTWLKNLPHPSAKFSSATFKLPRQPNVDSISVPNTSATNNLRPSHIKSNYMCARPVKKGK
ncbi:hypothetical protein C8F04DRAFT_1195022 [Mycena alexandri]|uniref:Uncharacterized protein n=1 Tax=Mycena alexandri TaxID=1745969 RepID=A0AAD6SAD8_9AGAR|nr:hypothetical protein C8F04DRAFT_1195022 [Mycena alexandri]